jgi:biotin synthase
MRKTLMLNVHLDREQILHWLREEDPARLEPLWAMADNARAQFVGRAVHLRGLIEISNYCVRQCTYCGLRSGNHDLNRYRMTADEILACAHRAVSLGHGTVVMQAGEDYGIGTAWLAEIIRRIKSETTLAVTLSLGERPLSDLAAWRSAGADRYLLRFETSEPRLYNIIHPSLPHQISDRVAILKQLRELGYEVGSGIMIGIPGQTYETVANDIQLFRELDLDMIGIGPYIAHPNTPLGNGQITFGVPEYEHVPNTELMVYKAVALTRLVCPEANIPSTTALATINQTNGRELGLQRGANVVMPNLTPPQYRVLYQIYPGKACISETGEACHRCLHHRIASIRREIGAGPGGRRREPVG